MAESIWKSILLLWLIVNSSALIAIALGFDLNISELEKIVLLLTQILTLAALGVIDAIEGIR